MRVKAGSGGRKSSWEPMPLDDQNDAAFTLPEEHHLTRSPHPPLQLEPTEEAEHVQFNGDDGDGGEEGEAELEEEDENKEPSTKLDEGFYEVEAIRRKRNRKGQLQYLIKWREWPETANTWEPLENLQSVADVVDTFEGSLRTGKQRKRKRKSGTPHNQPKKNQQRSSDTPHNETDGKISNVDKDVTSTAFNSSGVDSGLRLQPHAHSVGDGENNGHIHSTEPSKETDSENLCANVSHETCERIEENEYDPKVSELKATSPANNGIPEKPSTQVQEPEALEVNGLENGPSKVDNHEPVQGSPSTGAKRRKSGSVKRFKPEPQLTDLGVSQNVPTRVSKRYTGKVDKSATENIDYAGEISGRKNKIDEFKEHSHITKILKPIGYSTLISNSVQDVSVTFMATRSDGTEVIVDNKFLKVNDPLLLINYYEQHLRYSPAE